MSLSALSRVLLLYIFIKIVFKNFEFRQRRRSQRGPGGPTPNRNASNDKFVTKTAIFSSVFFSFLVCVHLDMRPLRPFCFVFCSSSFFREKFSSSDREDLFLLFFCFDLHYINCGLPPPILNWSPTKFWAPPTNQNF